MFYISFQISDIFTQDENRMNHQNCQTVSSNKEKHCVLKSSPFIKMHQLRTLNLLQNWIETLDNYTFSAMRSLEKLDLSVNRIRVIYNCAFCGLTNLKYLDLQSNLISHVYLAVLPRGTYVILKYNSFTDVSTLQSFEHGSEHDYVVRLIPGRSQGNKSYLFVLKSCLH